MTYNKIENYKIIPLEEQEEIPIPNESQGCIRRGYCCKNYPGWFGPGEIEKSADFLNLNVDDFVREYIVIDGIDLPDKGWIDVFTPVRIDRYGKPAWPPATRVDGIYKFFRGPCIFYKHNECEIYPVRPIECKSYFCGQDDNKNLSQEDIAGLWLKGL